MCMHVYICTYECMNVCMYVSSCMHVCMYVLLYCNAMSCPDVMLCNVMYHTYIYIAFAFVGTVSKSGAAYACI